MWSRKGLPNLLHARKMIKYLFRFIILHTIYYKPKPHMCTYIINCA